MPKSNLEMLFLRSTLNVIHELKDQHLYETMMESISSDENQESLKNICTKVPYPISDKIDEICSILNIKKRTFCEAAFLEAIKKAEEIMDNEGLKEVFKEAHSKSVSPNQEALPL